MVNLRSESKGISCSSSSIVFQESGRYSAFRKGEGLSLSIPGSSSCPIEERTMKLNEESSRKHQRNGSSSVSMGEGFPPFKRPKVAPVTVMTGNFKGKARIACSSSSQEEEEDNSQMEIYQRKANPSSGSSSMYHCPYKKLPSTGKAAESWWLETAFRMGVIRPELYLSKRVTMSDTDPNQHRFQLMQGDIENSMEPLQDLAGVARGNGVTVKVLDRDGRKYVMIFKYLASSHTYRFIGPDYKKFVNGSKLKANQIMDIWGLPRGNQGEHWFAFVNSDERMKGIEGDGKGGSNGTELPPLPSWKVIL